MLATNKENLATAQALTNAYANCGIAIDTKGYNKVGLFVKSDVNDSTGIILKAIAKKDSGADIYEIDGVATKALPVADANIYYEFDCGAIPLLQIQVKATVVGAGAGTITIDYTKVAEE
jgi:hypothetical protein